MSAADWPVPEALYRAFYETHEVLGFAAYILRRDLDGVRSFLAWASVRGCHHPFEVTAPLLEAYRAELTTRPGRNGVLKARTVRYRLARIKRFYRWLARRGDLAVNPFDVLTLPSEQQGFTRQGLSREELARVMALPNLATANGLRVRAILETFYSTGIRKSELARLMIHDVNAAAGLIAVREGKGRKDRLVPIGERGLFFIDRYLREARPKLLKPPDSGHLFLTIRGKPFRNNGCLSTLVRGYFDLAGILKEGACHLLRHSAATHMLRGGADLRHVQAFLGHEKLDTTSGYTKLDIHELCKVHGRCHPAERGAEGGAVKRP